MDKNVRAPRDELFGIGQQVGAENDGLRRMFTMMNSARVNVGSQGVQVAEAALACEARGVLASALWGRARH